MDPRVITHKKEMEHDHYTDSNKLILTWVWMLISTAKVRQSDVERIHSLVSQRIARRSARHLSTHLTLAAGAGSFDTSDQFVERYLGCV